MKKIVPLLLIFLLFSCSSNKKKSPQLSLDEIVKEKGKIIWARTHFPVSKVKKMNDARTNQVHTLIRRTCHKKPFTIIRQYKTDNWSLKLAKEYNQSRQVMVVEFKCRKRKKT